MQVDTLLYMILSFCIITQPNTCAHASFRRTAKRVKDAVDIREIRCKQVQQYVYLSRLTRKSGIYNHLLAETINYQA